MNKDIWMDLDLDGYNDLEIGEGQEPKYVDKFQYLPFIKSKK